MSQNDKLRDLIRCTKDFSVRRTWKVSLLKLLLGKFAWAILLRTLFETYQVANNNPRMKIKPSWQARRELRLVFELKRLILAEL